MPTPQLPGFGDIGAFIRWKKSIDYRLNLLFEKLNNVLANTGLSVPSPGVTQVDGTFNVLGTENVSGNLNVTGNETVSGNLNVTGSATIGGPTTISGATTVSGTNGIQSSNYVAGTSGWKFNGTSLEANTGVIGNGALANPVSSDQAVAAASSFGLSVAGASIVTVSKTVPVGFTSVVVTAFGRVAAINSTASADYLYTDIDVNGTGGPQLGVPVAAGGFNTSGAGYSAKLTGLTGGTSVVNTHIFASTGAAGWAANAGNSADLSVTYIWFR